MHMEHGYVCIPKVHVFILSILHILFNISVCSYSYVFKRNIPWISLLDYWCLPDVQISQDDYDQQYYSCGSETEPAIADEDSINEDSECDEEHWDVNDEEILIDFTQDDNLHKDQDQR